MDVIDFDEIKAMIISVMFIFNMMPNVNVIAVIIKYPEDRTTLGSMPPKIHKLCTVLFLFTSVHSLCWVTVCKMVAMKKPLQYE